MGSMKKCWGGLLILQYCKVCAVAQLLYFFASVVEVSVTPKWGVTIEIARYDSILQLAVFDMGKAASVCRRAVDVVNGVLAAGVPDVESLRVCCLCCLDIFHSAVDIISNVCGNSSTISTLTAIKM